MRAYHSWFQHPLIAEMPFYRLKKHGDAGGRENKENGAWGKKDYFLGLSASYSASTGAMVFVDMERRTSLVSFRQ
jgi:hypothetical protein